MQSKGSSVRFTGMVIRSPISTLMLSMFASFASLYVAGRLWQDAQDRAYLANELDRITGQGKTVMSVDDSWKIIDCREQQKKLSGLEMELAAARQEGFVPKHLPETNGNPRRKTLVVIGILTEFGRKSNRDAIRKAWMGTGITLKRLEEQKGIIIRFVIGRSSNRGDSLDRSIDRENKLTNDLFIVDSHVETPEELPNKTKLFFAYAAENWEADFFAKVNDDVYVNVDGFASTLVSHLDKPRVYIGCMISGEVFSEQGKRWYEPDWWKFGDGKTYFRHASGEMFVISQALAKFVSINKSILRTYAHDDVSVGSWFIGADVKHIDERNFCCSSWSSGPFLTLSAVCTSLFLLFFNFTASNLSESWNFMVRSFMFWCMIPLKISNGSIMRVSSILYSGIARRTILILVAFFSPLLLNILIQILHNHLSIIGKRNRLNLHYSCTILCTHYPVVNVGWMLKKA